MNRVWSSWAIPLISGLTALVAYAFALQIGLSYPLWAPMTVLIILQPTRGASYHLALQRLAGTLVGGVFAAALTNLGIDDSPEILILLFTTIMAFFTMFACIGRLINGYAFQVAGFTTIVVYMISYRYEFAEASAVSTMRVLETFIGVCVGLLSLVIVKTQSERHTLRDESERAIEKVRVWVRKVLQEGISLESRRLNAEVISQLNSLNDLSSYASSERFFIGRIRKRTTYLMGNLYTILSLTRALVNKGDLSFPDPNRTEDDIPELKQIFEKLHQPAPHFGLGESLNWKGGAIAFLRVLIAGFLAGVLWQFSDVEAGATFFLIALIHVGMLATAHRPLEIYSSVIAAEILSFFIVAPFMYFYGAHANMEIWAFLILILPGMLFVFIPKYGYLNTRIMVYSIVMYAICARQTDFTMEVIFHEYLAFLLALVFAVIMTMVFLPQTARARYSMSRRYLFYELRRVTMIRSPLDPKWMMTMYSDIERMLFYAQEVGDDIPTILNEGLTVIDISVEILELRSLVSRIPEASRKPIAKALAQITDLSLSVDKRTEDILNLVQKYESEFDARIDKTLHSIVKKINDNRSFFTQT